MDTLPSTFTQTGYWSKNVKNSDSALMSIRVRRLTDEFSGAPLLRVRPALFAGVLE